MRPIVVVDATALRYTRYYASGARDVMVVSDRLLSLQEVEQFRVNPKSLLPDEAPRAA